MQLARWVWLAGTVGLLLITGVAFADGSRVALGGYCPVAYVEMKQAVYGDAKQSATVDGVTYHFVDEKAKAMFEKNPARYTKAVRFDAWCATAMAMGKWIPSDPSQVVVRGAAVYLFSGTEAKSMFEKDPDATVEQAEANWKKMKKN